MDKDLIRSYLWNDVFQLGFRFENKKSRKIWLRSFLGSLREFWGLGDDIKGPSEKDSKIVGRIDNSHFNLWMNFELRDDGYLHIELGHLDGRVLFHHLDPEYFFPQLDKILDHTQRSVAVGEYDSADVDAVLHACMFHPREHLHIVAPNFDHHVRIGGGMPNPLLYLFHLRYQLCPIPQKRDAEKRRLLELFEHAIKNNTTINANDLMAQPDM